MNMQIVLEISECAQRCGSQVKIKVEVTIIRIFILFLNFSSRFYYRTAIDFIFITLCYWIFELIFSHSDESQNKSYI